MNKFLKKIKVDRYIAAPARKTKLVLNDEDLQALQEFAADWASLEEMRAKDRRSTMYAWGDQWGDLVKDPDTGQMITEGDLIKKNGKVPLKNNMIAPILNNMEGQLRNSHMKPVCVVRDQREAKLGEMMSVAVEYVHDINELQELDASCMKQLATGGVMAQRVEYGENAAKGGKMDVWVYPVDIPRLFFNTSVEDPRMWDVSRVGEIYDLAYDDVIAMFGQYVAEAELENIYGYAKNAAYLNSAALNGEGQKNITFYNPSRPDLCRVILGWRLENRPAIHWHDELRGTWGYIKPNEMHLIEEINNKRIEDSKVHGIPEDEVLLVNAEKKMERVWVYRYMSPEGYCLVKGESPYWHGEHNFILGVQHLYKGKLYNFVEQFIDQQRSINRTATMIDFIRGASSKGLLIVDEGAFESMTRQEIVDEYVRYNGVLFVKPRTGVNVRDVIHQVNGAASTAGDYELLNLQLKLINEISGVNSAMQGQAPSSGTPSSLYAQQVQNSSLNLKGFFGAIAAFRKRRDTKVMKTIQQFYNARVYLDVAGADYNEEAKWYNPEKVKAAEIDLAITEGNNSPAYQVLENDFLEKLFQGGAISVETLLENTSYPFASKILESIKREKQAAQDAMAQYPPQNNQMAMAMNNANAGADDGIIRKM